MCDRKNDLKFVPFSPLVEPSFWHTLSEKKLNEYKLNENEVPLQASYPNDSSPGLPPIVSLDYESFSFENSWTDHRKFPLYGKLFITNTIEDFKKFDKVELAEKSGKELWEAILNPEPGHNISSILSRFILLVFADLKKYHFYYWFCFPAVCFPRKPVQVKELIYLKDVIQEECANQLTSLHHQLPPTDKSYFLTVITLDGLKLFPLSEYLNLKNSADEIFITVADPSSNETHPGWPLRNLIAYALAKWKLSELQILCYRVRGNGNGESIILRVEADPEEINNLEYPGCVGWVKNEKQKLLPRMVDLSSTMDPRVLAANSVDLNLKLMRWRLVPELDLEKIYATKCLLLGTGTLGCNVARCLLAWGVRHITFVDSGKVSYSNPVRQSLFEFEDCINGGKLKAEAAAANTKKIYPNVISEGFTFTIPMPSHASFAAASEESKKSTELLEKLIKEHDCIFLLMDSRESRWLPTVIGQLVINAALGFDTYLVQRHGVPPSSLSDDSLSPSSSSQFPPKLGCYFCNDVVAPGDSSTNRTLDQQCTVTRPGVSTIAASLAVELMISVLQHPLGVYAAADIDHRGRIGVHFAAEPMTESILGIIPHQIRGFLSQFNQFMPTSFAFDLCTGCSPIILQKYKKEGFDFLMEVFQDGNLLESLTGLKKLLEETSTDDVWALSDDESG